ncbi:LacI family DNA-binding transcriptional regulator [Ligilactobacillus animalis]|jgi:LacI family transcriptional regulator|uniref:LacI family DNA-binding transcriptional regulator n=1 Tax=Ligilactobacillus animalis TaxID=1605 RepID=UPI0025998E05|nr:LacI family DNA-binding transcriptional regulator [Ligilactobacillus animalis]
MKVTIKKIAEEAGVSVTTVSNVINQRAHRVSKEKVALIRSIIEKYNYTPNQNARSLVQAPSKLIGLIYYAKHHKRDVVNPFVSEVLSGVEYQAKEKGYFVLFHSVQTADDLVKIQNNWKFAGFILVGVPSELFKTIDTLLEIPVVYIDTFLDAPELRQALSDPRKMFVNTEDSKLEAEATDYLITQGHEAIGFISRGFDENQPSVNEQRYLGYKEAMLAQGFELCKLEFSSDAGFISLLEQLRQLTAVVVTEDLLAIELNKFCQTQGLELSIIGMDDIVFAALIEPALTTIRIDHVQKGVLALDNLLANISKEFVGQYTNVGGKLIVRDSVKKIEGA